MLTHALVSQPKLGCPDEPTAAFDRKPSRDVVEIVQRLAKQHQCTILLVTDDNHILDITDRIIPIEESRLGEDKTSLVVTSARASQRSYFRLPDFFAPVFVPPFVVSLVPPFVVGG